MRRREALLGMTTVVAWMGGCSGLQDETTPGDSNQSSDSPDETEPEESNQSGESPTDKGQYVESRKPVRGEAEAISFDVVADGDDVEYLPESDAVRRVVGQEDGEDVYKTIDWTRFARTRCSSAATDKTITYVEDALGMIMGGGYGDNEVTVHIPSPVQDAEISDSTDEVFDRLVSVTPRSVTVRFQLADQEYSCEFPVHAAISNDRAGAG